MIHVQFLQEIFVDSYSSVKLHTMSITHAESVWQPPFGGNSINWIMGHLVVSRCNFMIPLGGASIWTMDQCMRFIPGSAPVTGDSDSVPFDSLLSDFDRTQKQLMSALETAAVEKLGQSSGAGSSGDRSSDASSSGDRSIAESLVYYQSHEAEHAGYLELLCRLARY